MKLDFQGQVVLLTGGSRGIGAQLARDFADAGATLVLTSTGPADLDALREQYGPETRHIASDFSDDASLQSCLETIRGMDRLDVLINNAGLSRHGPLMKSTPEEWDITHQVDLRAPFLLTQAAAEVMTRQQGGRIVNITSIWGHVTMKDRALYTAAKHGLRGLTSSSAADLASSGILVNAVAPGFTLTELLLNNYSDERRAELAEAVPLGRLAEPSEMSGAVLFLASRANTYITGQSLVVDGGYSIV